MFGLKVQCFKRLRKGNKRSEKKKRKVKRRNEREESEKKKKKCERESNGRDEHHSVDEEGSIFGCS